MPALMIQGCGSDVGKSVLVAGLCRLFARRGVRVAPFKPQNMSNNAAVTTDGGEIGRAQALQALACGLDPHSDMNPVLLKPHSATGAQVIVQGRVRGTMAAEPYQNRKGDLLQAVLQSYHRLKGAYDLVLVEGAGSPAEINLRTGDIANMGFALAAQVPVVLVGDIDRGHVIAALAGAKTVLDPLDAAQIKGFIINKFRGDPRLFDEGRTEIVRRTGWPDLGLVPWSAAARGLPSEDAVVLQDAISARTGKVRIIVPILPSIANFDDFDPLQAEPQVDFGFLKPGEVLPADADLVILPGAKATLSDLAFLRAQGWDIDILAHARRGGRVIGICGGYQMLGRRIIDAEGHEGVAGEAPGLGLLDLETRLLGDKVVRLTRGSFIEGGAPFEGYEIHLGESIGPATQNPWLRLEGEGPHGALSSNGRIAGAYIHGLFDKAEARDHILGRMGVASSGGDQRDRTLALLDQFADLLESTLDIPHLARLAGLAALPE